MKTLTAIISLSILSACGQSNTNDYTNNTAPPTKDTIQNTVPIMTDRHPSLANAHPRAKELMNNDWYYNPFDDMAPFGSDDAADTYASFAEWRQLNKTGSPKSFVLNHFQYWGYPQIDLETIDYEKLKPFLESNELGSRFLYGMDAAIIATAMGQLYLEGKIDVDIKTLARTAIQRQLLPPILDPWQELKSDRENRLKDFLRILDAAN